MYEWKSSSLSWEQFGGDINGEAEADASGNAVAISAGAYRNDADGAEDAGHVRIFASNLDVGDWVQPGEDIGGDENDDWKGMTISLSGRGTRIVVIGVPGSNDRFWPGVSKVYDFVNATTWLQFGKNLKCDGYSVDITFDGGKMALGSHRGFENGPSSGQVMIYECQSVETNT
jgi:hypothetical protein